MEIQKPTHLSIDVGGTKIRYATYSTDLELVHEHLVPVRSIFSEKRPEEIDRLFEHASKLYPQKFQRAGLSMKGAVLNNKVLHATLLSGGQGYDLEESCRKYLDCQTFKAANDVIAMTHGELKLGIGKECSSFLFVNIGTGIRFAYAQDGKVITGYNGTAGEVSQIRIWVDEFNESIKAHDLLSGQGISKLTKILEKQSLTAKEVFEQRKKTVIDIFSRYLAEFLQNSSYFYNPEFIVLGGSVALSADQFLPMVRDKYFDSSLNVLMAKDIVVSKVQYPASVGALLLD